MTTSRADSKQLEKIFLKVKVLLGLFTQFSLIFFLWFAAQYASVRKSEEWYMSPEDFVCRYLKLVDASNTTPEVIQLLAEIGDTSKDR